MAYKTIRNKILGSADKLIVATYYGKEWSTDGHFAIDKDLYSDYKFKKYQKIHDGIPKLDTVIDRDQDAEYQSSVISPSDTWHTNLVVGDYSVKVNKIYLELFKSIYQNLDFKIVADDYYKYSPVKVFSDNKLVGVIMPLVK